MGAENAGLKIYKIKIFFKKDLRQNSSCNFKS